MFRGQAVETDPVTPRVGPDGQFRGLNVVQGLRLISLNSSGRRRAAECRKGGSDHRENNRARRLQPHGSGWDGPEPIPFTTFDEFEFIDAQVAPSAAFTADSSEGRVFNIKVAGQAGIRFGGVGPVLDGTGPFQGMKGLMTDNSVVIFQPHVSASLYVLRLHDPDGRFRSRRD